VKIFPILFLFLLVSCDKKSVYSQFDDDFTENRWEKTDVRNYEFTITETGNYDLVLDFSHVYGFPFAQVPIKIEMSGPDGILFSENLNIELRKDDSEVSDCSGDYCDMQQEIFTKRVLKAGSYKVLLSNEFDHEYLPNVLGIGIQILSATKD